MSVLRYDPEGEDGRRGFMEERPDGDYVKLEDYEEALQQLRSMEEQLNMVLKENAVLREECTILRNGIVKLPSSVIWQD